MRGANRSKNALLQHPADSAFVDWIPIQSVDVPKQNAIRLALLNTIQHLVKVRPAWFFGCPAFLNFSDKFEFLPLCELAHLHDLGFEACDLPSFFVGGFAGVEEVFDGFVHGESVGQNTCSGKYVSKENHADIFIANGHGLLFDPRMSSTRNVDLFRQIPIQLMTSDEPLPDDAPKWTGFLKFCHQMNAGRVLGNAVKELFEKHKQVKLWPEVAPVNGVFRFELATELPFYLPALDGRHEYQIKISNVTFTVCLRMVRAYCGSGFPKNSGLAYFLVHRAHVPGLGNDFPGGLHPVPIKTFICRRFEAAAPTAEQAVQENLNAWREEFLQEIDYLTETMRVLDSEAAKFLIPLPSMASFPVFWLLAEGGNEKTSCCQILGGFEYGTFTPQCNLKPESVARIRTALEHGIPAPAVERQLLFPADDN